MKLSQILTREAVKDERLEGVSGPVVRAVIDVVLDVMLDKVDATMTCGSLLDGKFVECTFCGCATNVGLLHDSRPACPDCHDLKTHSKNHLL